MTDVIPIERPQRCRVCGSEHLKECYLLSRYTIVSCDDCGTKFNATYFDRRAFRESLFEDEYYDSVQSQAFKRRLQDYQSDPSVKVYSQYLDVLEDRFDILPGRVLDVGSAFGTFMKVAKERGWRPSGVEFSAFSSNAARQHWGFEIFNGDITECTYPDKEFDLVTYWDVIEHVADPRDNLLKARALLKDGGKLLVTTDNYDSLLSSLAHLMYKATLGYFTYPVEKFFIPHNTYYFTPANFEILLKETGFKPVHFERLDYPLEKLDVSRYERAIVRALYFIGDLCDQNTGFMFIAEKL